MNRIMGFSPPPPEDSALPNLPSAGDRLRWAREKKGLTQSKLAEACGWTSSGRIANYESNEREPARADWLRLSQVLGYAAGWLEFGSERDTRPYSDNNVVEGPAVQRLIPLISWVQAGSFQEPIDPYSVGDAEEWLPIPKKAGARAYALRVRGASMEPRYMDGDIIFVDPDQDPRHGSRVVVRLESSKEVTFKEMVIEGERRFLKALNPSWPDPLVEIKGPAVYCGVVIGKWTPE